MYELKGKEYNTKIKGVLLELITELEQSGIISRDIEEIEGKLIIHYYDSVGMHIGTHKNIHQVLGKLYR